MGTKTRLLALLVAGLFVVARSAPMWGVPMTLKQPDGTEVPVLVWGDEYLQRVESVDSLTLVRDSASGWICYASLSSDSTRLVSTGRKYTGAVATGTVAGRAMDLPAHQWISRDAAIAERERVRAQLHPANERAVEPVVAGRTADASATRVVVGLTVPVDFSDAPATIPAKTLDDLMNKQGFSSYSNNGSVRDFYLDVSRGHLDYSNIVTGYVRASKTKAYYNSTAVTFGVRARELVADVLATLQKRGFDFTKLTRDGNNTVYAVNLLYTGNPDVGWSQGIWPHMSWVGISNLGGVNIGYYELSSIGTTPQIGVMCHENGHMVMGWPDLYDYGYQSQGTGGYDLMSSGWGGNPVPPDPWLRDQAGWDSVIDLKNVPAGSVLQDPANAGVDFRFDNPLNAKEHFYVEARRFKGRSATLPDEGLAIWHIDENGSNNNEQMTTSLHYKVSLEQADGRYDLEKGKATGAGDLFHGGYKDFFSGTSTPNSNWWSGKASGFRVGSIGPVADTMSFTWYGGANATLLPALTPTKPVAGIGVGYAAGSWTSIPSFPATPFQKTAMVKAIAPTFAGGVAANYGLGYEGYFWAPQEGVFTFGLVSDHAARAWFDASLVADLDSTRAGQVATFSVLLAKGYHRLRLGYLNTGATPRLALTVAGPGITGTASADAYLYRENSWSYAYDPTTVPVSFAGLRYRYYEGTWTKLPVFVTLSAARSGVVKQVSAASVVHRTKDFGMVFAGYLNAPSFGSYTFYVNSADGSRLYVDGVLIANNDGPHAAKEVAGTVALYPGLHAVRVEYYQHAYTAAVSASWAGPGISKQVLPAASLVNDSAVAQGAPVLDDPSSTATVGDPVARMIGGMVEIRLPEGYGGAATVDLLDASGHVLATSRVEDASAQARLYMKHRGSSELVFVRVRMDGREVTKVVPLTF